MFALSDLDLPCVPVMSSTRPPGGAMPPRALTPDGEFGPQRLQPVDGEGTADRMQRADLDRAFVTSTGSAGRTGRR